MKTTDLIPIILYQLVDGDRYGYEIIKQIEDCSNGSIVIKQPTLYGILKKLEQNKFITSYWQDSEIGGKRHYYKLTSNGKSQLDTYPPLNELIKDEVNSYKTTIKNSYEDDVNIQENINNVNNVSVENYNNLDNGYIENNTEDLIDNIQPETIDLVQPSPVTTFNYDNILTENETKLSVDNNQSIYSNSFNADNSELSPTTSISPLDEDVEANFEKEDIKINDLSSINVEPINIETSVYANVNDTNNIADDYLVDNNNENITITPSTIIELDKQNVENNIDIQGDAIENKDNTNKTEPVFTNKVDPALPTYSQDKLYNKVSYIDDDLFNTKASGPDYSPVVIEDVEKIKYINYVDFSNDKATIKRRNAITCHIKKMILTCVTLLIILAISLILASKYGFSYIYCISAVVVGIIIVLYPTILLYKKIDLRLKYSTKMFKYNILTDFLTKLTLFLILGILIFAYNLQHVNDIKEIFTLGHLSSFIIPLVFSFCLLIDFVYSAIIYKQYKGK